MEVFFLFLGFINKEHHVFKVKIENTLNFNRKEVVALRFNDCKDILKFKDFKNLSVQDENGKLLVTQLNK